MNMISPAPVLLVGFGACILVDSLTRTTEASPRDFILFGLWEGVVLHCSFKIPGLSSFAASAVFLKSFIEFHFYDNRSIFSLLGIALGIVSTEVLSHIQQSFNSNSFSDTPNRQNKILGIPKNARGNVENLSHHSLLPEGHIATAISGITSIDSETNIMQNLILMSPGERLEREIKNLRMRASLADTERRRFKEEWRWAMSQGNEVLASQIKWQVKLYTTLMHSFHREADAKLIEASGGRPLPFVIGKRQPR